MAIKSFFQIRFAVGKGVCVCAKCARSLSGLRFEENFDVPPWTGLAWFGPNVPSWILGPKLPAGLTGLRNLPALPIIYGRWWTVKPPFRIRQVLFENQDV